MLKVATLGNVAGMSNYSEDNQKYYGLEIELAEDLASRIGYSGVEFSKIVMNEDTATRAEEDIDAIIACYSPEEERKAYFDFSEAYYTDTTVIVVEKSSLLTTVSDLENKKIGIIAASNTEGVVEKQLTSLGFPKAEGDGAGWTFAEFEDAQSLSDALESGAIDAMATDNAVAMAFMHEDRQKISGFNAGTQEYCVATKKGGELSEKVDAAIKEMNSDGTIEALVKKWG